jgi:hypothetical protein
VCFELCVFFVRFSFACRLLWRAGWARRAWRAFACAELVVVVVVLVEVVVDPVVLVSVEVVVVVPQAPIVSPCAMCAGSAFTLTVIVTNGFDADPVW